MAPDDPRAPAGDPGDPAALLAREHRLAAQVAGVLFALGALLVALQVVLPGVDVQRPGLLLAVAAVAAATGSACLLGAPGLGADGRALRAVTLVALALLAVAVRLTGGIDSPVRFELVLVVAYAACFVPVREAPLYFAACVAVHALPLAYVGDAVRRGFLAELLGVAVAYGAVGTLIVRGKQVLVDLRERERDQARRDPLTGLANRRVLLEALRGDPGRRAGDTLGLVLVDLDELKRINTNCGYPSGDEALRRVAGALLRSARQGDTVARLGGDEFAIAVRPTDPDGMRVLSERIRAAVRDVEDALGDPSCPIRVSMGWAVLPAHVGSADELVARADDYLREAKAAGKDGVRGAA